MPAGRRGRDRVSGAVLQQADAGWALRPFSVARLAELPRVIGLKDVSGDAMRPVRLRLGMDFRLPCGDDAGALAHLAQRGDGCISVTSNVAPGLCRNMYPAWKHGQSVRVQHLARPVAELTAELFSGEQSRSGEACASDAWSHVARGSIAAGRVEQSTPGRAPRHAI
jgi:dihydrodipicolinate synthase/N-acetylneuraminate lyase